MASFQSCFLPTQALSGETRRLTPVSDCVLAVKVFLFEPPPCEHRAHFLGLRLNLDLIVTVLLVFESGFLLSLHVFLFCVWICLFVFLATKNSSLNFKNIQQKRNNKYTISICCFCCLFVFSSVSICIQYVLFFLLDSGSESSFLVESFAESCFVFALLFFNT